MLILRRTKGQTIRIGDDIEITITGATGGVSVGIDAPENIRVLRGELITSPHTHADSRYRPEFDDGHGPTITDETGIFGEEEAA